MKTWHQSHQAARAKQRTEEDKMAEYKGAAKEGARAMALMKKREKMKADIEAAKNKISEVSFHNVRLGIWRNLGTKNEIVRCLICKLPLI